VVQVVRQEVLQQHSQTLAAAAEAAEEAAERKAADERAGACEAKFTYSTVIVEPQLAAAPDANAGAGPSAAVLLAVPSGAALPARTLSSSKLPMLLPVPPSCAPSPSPSPTPHPASSSEPSASESLSNSPLKAIVGRASTVTAGASAGLPPAPPPPPLAL
jgi:hypothetical protein